jgi:hypothetical protein
MVRAVKGGGLAFHADHQTAMAGMAQLRTHFLKHRFNLVKVNVVGHWVGEKAVKDFPVLVIHDELPMLKGICHELAAPL